MVGAIRKRDILAHPLITVHSFGWPVLLRALLAGRDRTFLSLLADTWTLRPPQLEVPELLGRCVNLELRAQRLYELLAARFGEREPVKRFFETLSRQEHGHCELLQLCRELTGREGWLEEHFRPWREAVPRLERQMDELEASVEDLERAADALRLVLRIEGSEINQVFGGVVGATDSVFVRNLQAFHTAEMSHIEYIAEQIPMLEPDLAGECEVLTGERFSEILG
jgi:rubrerythrin